MRPEFGALQYAFRYLRGPARLGHLIGVGQTQIRTAMRTFERVKMFGGNFEPLKHTDQYKAAILYALCRCLRPMAVVETGVGSGASSLGILMALKENGRGHLYSIDLPEATYQTDNGRLWGDRLYGRETGWLVPMSLRNEWSLLRGASRNLLPSVVDRAGLIGLFYHDSEHTAANMRFEFETAWSHMPVGGVLASDNVNWSQAFTQFCVSHHARHCLLFPSVGVAIKA